MRATYFENGFLILRKGVFTDQLHDFSEIFFFLQNFSDSSLQSHEVGIVLVVIVFKDSVIV